MPTTPTFILVPGHWHTTTHLQPLLTTLHCLHLPAKPCQLPSVGLKTPRPTFASDVDEIHSTVSTALQAGEDVCLVLHSIAGMAGAEAVNRLLLAEESQQGASSSSSSSSNDGAAETGKKGGKLRRVIFIAAFAFPAGTALDAKEFIEAGNQYVSVDENDMVHMASPQTQFFNDLSPSEAEPWVEALDATYYLGQQVKISSEEWRRRAPVAAVLCRRDYAVPLEQQEEMWRGVEREWIDAGHTPYVSRPGEVAEILARLGAAA